MTTILDAYLKRQEISDADFGALIQRDRSIVSKIRRGVLRPTLDVAAAIEAATSGELRMQIWVSDHDPADIAAQQETSSGKSCENTASENAEQGEAA